MTQTEYKNPEHMNEPVLNYAEKNVTVLNKNLTVGQTIEILRQKDIGERIIYFYVVDDKNKLIGVLPTRKILSSHPETILSDIMIENVVSIYHTSTIQEACEQFITHKFLAYPVVDENMNIRGVVDIGLFSKEVVNVVERQQTDEVFEIIGFRLFQLSEASPFRAFRFRFPWLMATIASGLSCAVLTSFFELTLAKSIILAFFITLVLALGESVSVQTMTITIQALRYLQPTLKWYIDSFRKESITAILLGTACGFIVGSVAFLWKGVFITSLVIGCSIFLSLCSACLIGLSVPTVLHALKLDPKISAGPFTLAITDIFTLLFYFGLAAYLI